MMKNRRGEVVASTLVTRTVPLVRTRLFVSFVQELSASAGLVEARNSIPVIRFGAIALPLAVRAVSWNLFAPARWGASSLSAGTERSKQAPKELLRTYTRPSATAGQFQHLL